MGARKDRQREEGWMDAAANPTNVQYTAKPSEGYRVAEGVSLGRQTPHTSLVLPLTSQSHIVGCRSPSWKP